MYLFDYARRLEVVLLHSRGNKVKQSPLIDSRPNLINLPRLLEWIRSQQCLFCFGRGETTLSWCETTLSWGETTLSWVETTLSWGETTLSWGETTPSWGETTWGETTAIPVILLTCVWSSSSQFQAKPRFYTEARLLFTELHNGLLVSSFICVC